MAIKLTGEIVKSAISFKIKNSFATSDSYPTIYKEQIVEGMDKPCFFVGILDVSQTKGLGDKHDRTYMMQVRYHVETGQTDLYEQLDQIGNELLDVLRYISIPFDSDKPQLLRGTNLSYNIVDGVLQVFVTYTVNIQTLTSRLPIMEQLTINDIPTELENS